MNADTKSPAAVSGAQERKIILLLCCLAAVRVFIFSAAFPPVNNVDEQMHFDMAVKYSHGHLPRGLEPISREAMRYIVVYGSQEFLWPPETFPDGKFPPPAWTQPAATVAPMLLARETKWQTRNFESSQPPLYYALAGFWWDAGQWLGFAGGTLVYWLRFLNILLVAALVWLGYIAARMIFQENFFPRLGVPALLAFFPQTAFYSVNNDILSPLCFGAAFMGLIQLWRAEIPGARLGAATGLALAAVYLAKVSNLPLLAVSGAFVALKTWRLREAKKLRASAPALAALILCIALPAAAWTVWCKINFGDFSGSAEKINFLGWTVKPFAEWWHHPIFTPPGAWTFASGLLAAFWQGEFWWHGQPMVLPSVGMVYVLTTLGIVAPALAGRFAGATEPQRQALGFALANLAASVLFFVLLSVIYDFHDCANPSRDHPYFTSGRLMLGTLIPFLLVYVYGLERALGRWGNRAKYFALAGMILFMLISEIVTDAPAFSSQYNWFHM